MNCWGLKLQSIKEILRENINFSSCQYINISHLGGAERFTTLWHSQRDGVLKMYKKSTSLLKGEGEEARTVCSNPRYLLSELKQFQEFIFLNAMFAEGKEQQQQWALAVCSAGLLKITRPLNTCKHSGWKRLWSHGKT